MSPHIAVTNPPATLPDEEIVARVIAGETALFELLMRRHNQRVYRAARAILRDDREAEDAGAIRRAGEVLHVADEDCRLRSAGAGAPARPLRAARRCGAGDVHAGQFIPRS
jgi:hypothetical protein